METLIHNLNINDLDMNVIDEGAAIIRKGGTVVFPTETVYGLGANALAETSVNRIFHAKGRPSDNPLIVHVSNHDMLLFCIREPLSEKAKNLISSFWPGPLTIVFKKSKYIPDNVTGGLDTVAIRMPNNKVALELIERSMVPIAAPSANISGKPSPTAPEHVISDMGGKVDMILLCSDTVVGVESTVIDISGEIPIILRPGGVTKEDLEIVLGEVNIDPGIIEKNASPKSPGMKYTHYAPDAQMVIIKGKNISSKILQMAGADIRQGLRVGILTIDANKDKYKGLTVISIGGSDEEAAHNFFNALREFDKIGVDKIYAEALKEEYLGLAVMNRMKKAAGFNIIEI